MNTYRFTDNNGSFYLEQPQNTSNLYFPIAGENGIKSAITPMLQGDSKIDHNHFLLQPVSAEDLHNNKSSRNFWCHVEGKGSFSATGVSAESMGNIFSDQEEKCTLEAGIMWQKVYRYFPKYQLKSEITSFVPVGKYNTEIMMITIENVGEEETVFTPYVAVPLYARSADNLRDHRHVTSLLNRIYVEENGISVSPTLSFDERGHRKNDTIYYVAGKTGAGESPAEFYPTLEDFIGEGGNLEHPKTVMLKLPGEKAGLEIDGYEAMGAFSFKETSLKPKEKQTFILLLGIAESVEEKKEAVKTFETVSQVEKALEETKKYWINSINVSYKTADNDFDNFMYWVNFQPTLRRIYGCSFLPHHDYGKGGRGWRDLWQDCLALLIMNPSVVRDMLIQNFAGVRIDGTNATIIGSRPGEFIADRNNITRVWMDHGVWPFITTKLYLDQTGDLSILLKEVEYFKDKQVSRGEKIDFEFVEGKEPVQEDGRGQVYFGTILEHLLIQNITCFYEVGQHNHMKLRGADWNDALDMAKEQGESVAFSAAYAGNLEDLAEVIEALAGEKNMQYVEVAAEMEEILTGKVNYESVKEKNELLQKYCDRCEHTVRGDKVYIPIDKVINSLREKAQWLKEHIRKTEWVGDGKNGWFNSYYDNSGNAVEGVFNDKVRMMLTGQVFTIMSGTASKEQVESIVKSADLHLYQENVGGYRLNTDFGELKMDLGRMFGFAYGHKENGAVFSHMTTMYANALYKRGFALEGYKALKALYKQAITFENSRIYPGIPEYFSPKGRGMYHYLTGAASWLMLTVITQMFGVKGKNGALILKPQLVAEQFNEEGRCEIKCVFRGRRWKIIYINRKRKEFGSYKVGVVYLNGNICGYHNDGEAITGEQIKQLSEDMEHEIIVELI